MNVRLGYLVCIADHFDAAHELPKYPGKCSRMHGHRWTVQVRVDSPELDVQGMVIDFAKLKQALHEACEQLDHRVVNDVLREMVPTAENLAQWFFQTLLPVKLDKGIGAQLVAVRVYESPDCYAEYGWVRLGS